MGSAEFHVHTNVSWCAGEDMSPAAMRARAAAEGLSLLGFADHLWLDPKRGCRPALARVLGLRRSLAALPPSGPRTLAGAEADCAPGLGAAGGEGLRELDFVVAAYHFADVRTGLVSWPRTPEELARILLDGFRSVIDAPGVRIAGHPFFIPPSVWRRLPEGLREEPEEAFAVVARSAGRLLALAAERGIAIELNAKALGPWARETMRPVVAAARECGCRFALSSDAHLLGEIGRSLSLSEWVRSAGIGSREIADGEGWPPPSAARPAA